MIHRRPGRRIPGLHKNNGTRSRQSKKIIMLQTGLQSAATTLVEALESAAATDGLEEDAKELRAISAGFEGGDEFP